MFDSADSPAANLTAIADYAVASRRTRRAPLLAAMQVCQSAGYTCTGCRGVCCTAIANSMQLTPLEALDLYLWLVEVGRWNADLVQHLQEHTARYGLDRPPLGDGRRVFSRRHYTCPFFVGGGQGCSVSRQAKPYGCLAFNARAAGVREGENCGSDQPLLAERELIDSQEVLMNSTLARVLKLDWEKRPLPTALLAIGKLFTDSLTRP